jgi:hypothetical protein
VLRETTSRGLFGLVLVCVFITSQVVVYYCRCVFITTVPIIKLFAWGEGHSGGDVLREKTSQGLGKLVCPSRTSERGREGDCVKLERRRGRRRGAREGARESSARALGQVCVFITAVLIIKLFAWGEGDSGG